MRILITGANGYIGSRLVSYFNNLKNSNSNFLLLENTVNLVDFKNVVSELINLKPDIIIHCAGASSVPKSIENPYIDFEKNVLTTRNLLEAIRVYSLETQFIYMSSAAVYGNSNQIPISEKNELNPISPYGYSKLCSEILIRQYTDIYNLKCAVLRIFSIYGNGMEKQVVYDIFNKFFDSNYENVELFGTGEEERDFIHIDDLKGIIKFFIQNKITGIYNIASGNSTKIKDLAKAIKEVTGSEKGIQFKGEVRKGDPLKWQVDINKIKQLGFQPSISLEEGIKMYYEWYRSSRNHKN